MKMGTVLVNKDKAKQCAENYIKYWEAREEKFKQEAIAYEMGRSWLFRAKNPEEALSRHECIFGDYKFTRSRSWYYKAETIIAAIGLSAIDNLAIDIDTANWLAEHVNEVKP